MAKMFDLRTKIMIGIGSSLLVAAMVLLSVVFCLYFKVAKALKAAKDPDAVVVKNHNPDKVCWATNSQAKATTMESCPSLQCCEGCRMHASFDSLPPCCCDINEGL
ncbi:FAM24A isoform 1 [Pan troglodytes]|uniref:FAM24A isoform 1 n=3 Tax=Pan TaxID=9596 RepID=A0A6D2WFF7_PANTR|nr:protein FAM24A [Pan paniscus]PNI81460.1 FAM24A isoform 1 [Pan troglodytes]